jgi:hypothetical protein
MATSSLVAHIYLLVLVLVGQQVEGSEDVLVRLHQDPIAPGFGVQEGSPVLLDEERPSSTTSVCPGVTPPKKIHRRVYRNHSARDSSCINEKTGHDCDSNERLHVFDDTEIVMPYSLCMSPATCYSKETDPKVFRTTEEMQAIGKLKFLRRLDKGSLHRSRKTLGNVYRFRHLLCKLWAGTPVKILVIGGSNCQNAYLPSWEDPWPVVLEEYLNEEFPVKEIGKKHEVTNFGSSGAGSCVFAPRLRILLNASKVPYDMLLAEFGINDAQFAEQGSATTGFYASPPMGAHYEQIEICTEILIRNALDHNPTTPLVFLELPSWSLRFSNAGEVIQTVANFYQIPYISLKDAVWPAMRSHTGLFKNMTQNEIHGGLNFFFVHNFK